jgi:asparagine synthase (glutamine-hydrolysing)
MSVQFGRWNWDGKPVDPTYLAKVNPIIAPYGPDDGGSYSKPGISILYRAFHTTKESRRESHPHVTNFGVVITWDGRLDNRTEIMRHLRDHPTINSTDISIVAAAYEEWGAACFAKLIGDWALSIWDAKARTLILAKDAIGTRHLYYSIDKNQVTWSTILDPLVLFSGKSFALCEEYIAGWFSFFPATHLTPYVGIHSVPPSSSVVMRDGKHTVTKYWDFDPAKCTRYDNDANYEEHFRTVFAEAIRRRLRSDRPILAELSGGMDSSSIVCMADTLVARGDADAPKLDTVSYYDDSEPNWNERPFFRKVEEQRGRTGLHIDVGSEHGVANYSGTGPLRISPGSEGEPSGPRKSFHAFLAANGHRVILSGFGGDEVLGGVPLPTSELADLAARVEARMLARQLKVWAFDKRRPWFHLFWETVRRFLPLALTGCAAHLSPAPWLDPNFVARQRLALTGYESRIRLFGPLPTFQENLSTIDALRRQLGSNVLPAGPTYDKCYPYLDRDLLEFLFAVPREQLLRPGQRRSLMRRALVGIVPAEILNRKRKAFVARRTLLAISDQFDELSGTLDPMLTGSLGIINPSAFHRELQKARAGRETFPIALLRTIGIEAWLRNLAAGGLLEGQELARAHN